jgi:hypothetical protein
MQIYPEGIGDNNPEIYITCKLTRPGGLETDSDFYTALYENGTIRYDVSAGYEVYHFVQTPKSD